MLKVLVENNESATPKREMDFLEGVLLSSWNCILGPQVEFLWIPNNNNSSFQLLRKSSLLIDMHYSDNQHSFWETGIIAPETTYDIHDNPLSNIPDESFSVFSRTCNWSCMNQNSKCIKNIGNVLKTCGQLLISEAESIEKHSEIFSRLFFSEHRDIAVVAVVFQKTEPIKYAKTHKTQNTWLCLAVLLKYTNLNSLLGIKHVIDSRLRKAAKIIKNSQDKLMSTAKGISFIVEDIFSALYLLPSFDLGLKQASSFTLFQSTPKFEFSARAIASHLHTCGFSVVVGDSRCLVNQVICMLGMFSNSKERLCSQVVSDEKSAIYQKNLNIQGFLKSDNETLDMLTEEPSSNQSFVTVIDTTRFTVHKMNSEKNYRVEENRNSLQLVNNCGKLVPEMMQDIALLERNKSKSQYVYEFCTHLKVKSISLLKIIRKSRTSCMLPREANSYLGLLGSTDFSLVLGYAEKIRPGISIWCDELFYKYI